MHRLFHSLVFSSFLAFEAVGCTLSHDRGGDPASGDAGPRTEPDSGFVPVDAGRRPRPRDAGVLDAGQHDAGAPDAGMPDAGMPDAGMPDAGMPDGGDLRACEEGWPTTKALFCEEMAGVFVCCDSTTCCIEDR